MSEKYYIKTYGCQMNKSDSERIVGFLEKIGYRATKEMKKADLIVVNMCSVRQSAVDRVYGLSQKLKELKTKKTDAKIVLTGCVLKKDKNKFLQSFDFVLSVKNLSLWPKHLKIKKKQSRTKDYFDFPAKRNNKYPIFVPISNGCNNFCSYCVVPFARGPLICRSHKKILKEIKNALKDKDQEKEIWLLGQNVNDYQSPDNPQIDFARLIKTIDDLSGNFKFFFLSSNPKNFSDQLIETLAQCKKFGKHLNLPVQSGDNEILKKMKRPYRIEKYKNLVKKIRKKIPEINLSTDVIIGFPGERKKHFQNTAKLLREIKFNRVYLAKYSPRPGTPAFKIKDNISFKEKKRREKILNNLVKK